MTEAVDVETLKARARTGDAQALQQLRDIGFFEKKTGERTGFAASHAQKRLWVVDRLMDGRSSAYNVAVALRLQGPLDRDAFGRALERLVRRHEALRTRFAEIDGEPRQFIEQTSLGGVPLIDLRARLDREAAACAEAAREAAEPFDLACAPLLRARLLWLDRDEHVLLLTAHHIVFDQWSAGVFVRDLGTLYGELCAGVPPTLEPLAIQYKDFAAWQNRRLGSPEAEPHRRYWLDKLRGPIGPLAIPADRPRLREQTFAGGVVTRTLDPSVARGLEELARARAATVLMAFAAAFKALLFRYTGQHDVVIGTTTSGRDRSELADQIGFYVNSLALRDWVDGRESFVDLLDRVRTTAAGAYEHQEYPFDRLVDELALERDLSRSPLFDVMLIVNDDAEPAFELAGLRISPFDHGAVAAKYDLTIDISRAHDSWSVRVIYNTGLYEPVRIERLLAHLERLIAEGVAHPDAPLGQLDLLPAHERREIIERSRGISKQHPRDSTIVSLFEARAARTPDRPAVRTPQSTRAVSYGELNARAAGLAAVIDARTGGGIESRVAVMLNRGEDLIAALLAVMKSGSAYLPLDPAWPSERLAWLLQDANVTAILTSGAHAARLSALTSARIIDIDRDVMGERPSAAPAPAPAPQNLAYLIYTSGSTGTPKGVAVEHHSFVNMIVSQIETFGVQPDDVVLQFASCSFDASLSEIFMALLSGACLMCPSEDELKDPATLLHVLREERVTVATLPPPYIRALGFGALSTLRTLITAGEAAVPDEGALTASGGRYWNAYGPTEFSVCATMGRVPASVASTQSVPIGRPIANGEVLIVEPDGVELRSAGIPGEICLAGAGLARGYHDRPALTAASFVPHPLQAGRRMYRTGDLGCWREDGTLEFLGRLDHQIKVRGYRIEPGEIEEALRRQPGVTDALVLQRDGFLDAFIVPSRSDLALDSLGGALAARLPAYMVPDRFVVIDDWPLLPSGKVDRKALPSAAAGASAARTLPRNAIERALVGIWQHVLGAHEVGIRDRFLDLGGNSMKAILMVSRVLRELGIRIPIRQVFEDGTIAALADACGATTGIDPIPVVPAAADYAVSHAQRRLWTIDRMEEGAGAYNIPGAIRLEGDVDLERVRDALSRLADRHESLRTTFVERDGVPRQVVHDHLPLDFDVDDVQRSEVPEATAREQIEADLSRPFDLTRGPLFRARVYRTATHTCVFYLNIHHAVGDGASLEVFFRDLVHLYGGSPSPLPALAVQYKDFAAWQNARATGELGQAARAYWRALLAGERPLLDLPSDRPRPRVKSFRGGTVTLPVDAVLCSGLARMAKERGATMVALWLSFFYAVIHRYTGAEDLTIGVPATLRDHPDLDDQIGFFVNMMPLRLHMKRGDSSTDLFARVRALLGDAFEHRHFPYDLLVEDVAVRRDLARNPLFDIALSVQERDRAATAPVGTRPSPFALAGATSKFDLTLFASESDDGRWDLTFEYDADLFARIRIERLGRHLLNLAASALARPDASIDSLELLDAEERRLVCDAWNRTASAYPRERSIASVFEEVAAARPDHPAVECGGRCLTYRELNARANDVAWTLIGEGVRPEEPVGVLLEPSESVAVGLLGILKAGGAYVPLDPGTPHDRLQFLVDDAGCRLVVSSSSLTAALASCHPDVRVVDIDRAGRREDNPPARATGGSLAYVMYTSGSTGAPKGTLIEHRAVLRLVLGTNDISWLEGDRVLQAGSLAFDASTLEIWGPLLNGAVVVFPPRHAVVEPAALARVIEEHRITTMWVTASLFNQLVDHDPLIFARLRQLFTGGERLSPAHVARVRAALPDLALTNGYGPTENTTFTTCYRIDETPERDVPIGRPVANSSVFVLDRALRPAPVGVPGEICAGGDGLARGYLRRPALTAERFVPHPFVRGARLYRTGDIGRWRADGLLEILGRLDDQVKVRGYRVEPAEIEAAMRQGGAVDAVVVHRVTSVGTNELVGYFTSASELDAAALREALRTRLPAYLLPAYLVALDRLPLTPNGKVDKRALPAPEAFAPRPDAEEACSTPAELALSAAWADVLGGRAPGLDDNYFDHGGDSIQAIQMASRLRRAGWLLRVRDIFQQPTIRQLAAVVQRVEPDRAPAEDRSGLVQDAPLSPIQAWFFRHVVKDRHHFNQSVLVRVSAPVDEAALASALSAIWRRHDALSATFHAGSDGSVRQSIRSATEPLVHSVVDLRSAHEPRAALLDHTSDVQRSFALDRGPLVRVVVYRMPDGDRLFVAIHHLVVDVVSWRIVLEDLEAAYTQAREGAAVDLGPAGGSYFDWIHAIGQMILRGDFEGEREYWAAAVAAAQAALPHDIADAGPGTFGEADAVTLNLDEETTTDLLERTHRAYGAGVDELLLTSLVRALSQTLRPGPWTVNVESHGRESDTIGLDLGRMVGWFTSLHPVVLDASGHSAGDDLRRVKEAARRVPRGGIGYAALGLLDPDRAPLVTFNYLGRFDGRTTKAAFTMADDPHGADIGPSVGRIAHLEVGGAIAGRRLELTITFSQRRFRRATIERLAETLRAELDVVIGHCRAKRLPEKTPSDFTSSVLTLDQYDRLLGTAGLDAALVEDIYVLAPLQAGLFFQHRLDPGSPAYHVQMDFGLRGTVHTDAYRAAWAELARRHPMLRTVFVEAETRAVQVVLRALDPEFTFEDLSSETEAGAARRIAAHKAAELARPFDLGRAPLWRVALFRTAPDRHRAIWSCHHILIDGWSLGLLHRELGEVYAQLAERGAALSAPARPFADFVRWLERADMTRGRAYWSSYLDGLEARTALPRAPGAGRRAGYAFAERTFELDARVTAAVQRLAASLAVTPYTLIQAAWSVVLSRYTGASDVVFGSIVSGRPPGLEGVDEIVGPFINAVPVRVKIGADVPFAGLARQLQQDLLQQADAHFVPLAEIQTISKTGPELFDHLLVFENYPVDQALRERVGSGFVIESFEAHDQSHYDLNMVIVPGARLQFRISHNANVHPADWIERMVGHLFATLDRAAAAPETLAVDIDILPAGERRAIAETFQGARCADDRQGDETVVDLFRRQVARTPERTAVHDRSESLTYRALDAESDRVAAYLVDRFGIGRNDRVAVLLDRSPRLIAVLLGVLKAGGGYVPVDPNYPRDRIAFLLEDSAARAVISDADALWAEMAATPNRARLSPGPDDLAYAIYTSGSTGRPKGCQIEHRNLTHYLDWAARAYLEVGRPLTFGLYSSIAFDLTVTTLFLPLTTGGTIRVPARDLDVHDALRELFDPESGVDAVKLTPSHIALLPELRIGRTNVSLAIVGGEALTREHVAILRGLNSGMAVFNEYGPTETTVGCIVKRVDELDADITIGRPIDDTRIYLLDGRRRLVPVGVPGEIYIGGRGVGRGYLGRPDLTADRFVADPIAEPAAGGRCYRTGDLGRWLPNGEIEYLGRADDQLKIRGHRIEPGEIEAAIARCGGVEHVAAVARAVAGSADTALVAYIVGSPDIPAIRAALSAELPEVMIPSHFVVLERMPLTPNGKLDRRALPDPAAPIPAGRDDAPLTANETLVAGIWQSVLGVERVGREDDFFTLGGHSLKAAQIAAGIYHRTGVRISLKDFLAAPTVARLAARLDRDAGGAPAAAIPTAQVRDTYPLSHAQERLWLLHQMPGGDVAYNIPLPVVIEGCLDIDALERAFAALVARHEALRTAFVSIDGEPRQRILPWVDVSIRRVDLREFDDGDARARALAEADAHTRFDLSQPPLVRLTVATLGGRVERHLVVLTMHHIVGDGWSQTVLVREIDALYHAFRDDRPNPLPSLRIQYKDFAEWQRRRDFADEEAWWLTRLAGAPDRIALPYDFAPSEDRAFLGATVDTVLDAATTQGLRAVAASRGVTLAHTVLAVFQLVLYRLTGQQDLCVGMSVAGRTDRDLERLVGFFVNILPVRTRFREETSLDALIADVSQSATDAFDHQDCPFDLLVRRIQPQRVAARQPLVNVVFAFQNFADVRVDDGVGGLPDAEAREARAFDFSFGTSKFDMTLFVEDQGHALRLVLEYDTGLFLPATARKHLDAMARFAALAAKRL